MPPSPWGPLLERNCAELARYVALGAGQTGPLNSMPIRSTRNGSALGLSLLSAATAAVDIGRIVPNLSLAFRRLQRPTVVTWAT